MYEQGDIFSETSASIRTAPSSICAMEACDPRSYFDFLGDYHDNSSEPSKLLFSLCNEEGSSNVHRAHFLIEKVRLVPKDIAKFRKWAEKLDESDDQVPFTLCFADGTTATVNAVIGADGVKNHVWQSILGVENPESHAGYSYKYVYRGLILMEKAIAELGEDMAANAEIHLGPEGHVITFPVDKGETINSTRAATKQDALNDYACWSKNIIHIISLLNGDVDICAIFDILDHLPSTHAKERKIIIGNAAHGTSSHHVSGASFDIEDSTLLAEMLAKLAPRTRKGLRAVL
ncbi:hypothetical protein BOTCAL_0511g00030 [Botryotinia calthae]|uniref:FAD-binding domain-containing protein n=1 Tax=Botryotinia calthae TaxID=38488 RepID=A0A4Y8CNB5_9HELO|nr:hypothetical protein BOTCAL_0511g00030 [Botryotinia calthae]